MFFILLSCNENPSTVLPSNADVNEIVIQKTDKITIYKVTNLNLTQEVRQALISSMEEVQKMAEAQNIKNVSIESFDFDNLYKSVVNGVVGESFSVNYKGASEAKIAFAVFRENDQPLINPTLISVRAGKNIEYGLVQTGDRVIFEKNNDEVRSVRMNINTPNQTGKITGCGNAVALCIQDAYSNHGWGSVYVFLQTLALPQTGAAIAAACAIKNCT